MVQVTTFGCCDLSILSPHHIHIGLSDPSSRRNSFTSTSSCVAPIQIHTVLHLLRQTHAIRRRQELYHPVSLAGHAEPWDAARSDGEAVIANQGLAVVVASPREASVVIVQGEVEGRGDGLAAGVGRVEAFNNFELHGQLGGNVAAQVDGEHHAEGDENEITQAIEEDRVTTLMMLTPPIRRSRFLHVGVVFVKQRRKMGLHSRRRTQIVTSLSPAWAKLVATQKTICTVPFKQPGVSIYFQIEGGKETISSILRGSCRATIVTRAGL
jgi:hypothetical protein